MSCKPASHREYFPPLSEAITAARPPRQFHSERDEQRRRFRIEKILQGASVDGVAGSRLRHRRFETALINRWAN
jgi:hypothetical protein